MIITVAMQKMLVSFAMVRLFTTDIQFHNEQLIDMYNDYNLLRVNVFMSNNHNLFGSFL